MNITNLLKECNDNKELLCAYVKGESIEHFKSSDGVSGSFSIGGGKNPGLFIAVLVIVIIIWIWGLVVLIKFWPRLEEWAKITGVIGMVTGFPVLTVITSYIGRKQSNLNFTLKQM